MELFSGLKKHYKSLKWYLGMLVILHFSIQTCVRSGFGRSGFERSGNKAMDTAKISPIMVHRSAQSERNSTL